MAAHRALRIRVIPRETTRNLIAAPQNPNILGDPFTAELWTVEGKER
jgi:hypothetical protein